MDGTIDGLVTKGSLEMDFIPLLGPVPLLIKCSICLDGFSAGLSNFCWLDNRSIRLFSRLSTSVFPMEFLSLVLAFEASDTQCFFKLKARAVERPM